MTSPIDLAGGDMCPEPQSAATYLCPDCRRARLFEQPITPDEAGDATSGEWACTVCGAALLVDPVLVAGSVSSDATAASGAGSRAA